MSEAEGSTNKNIDSLKKLSSHELPAEESLGVLEPVTYFNGAMPTGVTKSHQGRIFVNFPKWGDDVQFTVAEIRNGETVAYPDEAINRTDPDNQAHTLVSVPVGRYRIHLTDCGFLTRADHCSSQPSMADQN